jgi:4-hydroxy-3-methylbut-2-en-1-yl diphosphate reductase
MKILRATHLGMCFGVRDAIALAMRQAEPITIFGDLVHNESVLRDLRDRGVNIQHQVAGISTRRVMITAHGASQKRLHGLAAAGHEVVEATCPLVRVAHRALGDLVSAGYYPVIVGKSDHVEVRGLTEDLAEFATILTKEEVVKLPARPRFGVMAQTTQPVERVRDLAEEMRRTFPNSEVRLVDTVCQPTKLRQLAAIEMARECDAVIVIGGLNSNNTRELVQTCRDWCERVHHVQSAQDLHGTWLAGVETIGITAGTSTPDEVVNAVERWLQEFAAFQDRVVQAVEVNTGRS